MLLKEKRVKLKGKALRELNDAIHDRDHNQCVICGRWVDIGEKFHHEPCGSRKSDEINKGVTLCGDCHFKRHFSKECNQVKGKIESYLRQV